MKKFYSFCLILFTILLLSSCDSNNYTETSYTYRITDEITDIDINWNIGKITITSGDSFTIEEKSIDGNGIAPLIYSITDNKLSIDYNDSKKDINITLDKRINYDIINLNSVVSNLYLEKVSLNRFKGTITKGNLNILSSNISHCDAYVVCQDNWAWSNIKYNHFNTINVAMKKIDKINFISNTCNYSSFYIENCSFFYENNTCKTTNISLIQGKIELSLSDSLGYDMTLLAKKTIIDFETLCYTNRYIYKTGERKIYCSNINGEILVTRFF